MTKENFRATMLPILARKEVSRYLAVLFQHKLISETSKKYAKYLEKMQHYRYVIENPNLNKLGHVVAVANIDDKHDRSAPSHYHWKVLKCRMIIFSTSSIIACPDKKDIKQVHIVFNKVGDDYDKLTSLFLKYSLIQDGTVRNITPEIFQMCFEYTMSARIAPAWNVLGYNYLINNRNFLTSIGPQEGIQYQISSDNTNTVIDIKPIKINLMISLDTFSPGEWIRVLPSLNKAIVDKYCSTLSETGTGHFKCYKDLRRHWKNIHGYRLPEEECPYYLVQFWRGEPLTYPKICVIRNFPIITPIPRPAEEIIVSRFINCLQNKIPYILGTSLQLQLSAAHQQDVTDRYTSQTISLCTPTQWPPHPTRHGF